MSASGLASTVAGFEQIGGQLANLQSGDMVVINNRRYLAVRPASDGQRNTMILIEASDDSYTLDAKVRHSVSQNLNAKSDGYSKSKCLVINHRNLTAQTPQNLFAAVAVASAVRDFSSSGYGSGRQSVSLHHRVQP